jgi:1-acyl-sn-glycerol-3-phosphate acyltransferase
MMTWILYILITFSPRILKALGIFRWNIEGLEHLPPRTAGGMIIATNHVHWVDILALGALVPYTHRLSWFGKRELFESDFGHWFFTTMHVVPVNRGKGDVSAMQATAQALQDGAVFAIFPEGHRNPEGNLQKGYGGAIRLAMQGHVPIVPAAITGSQHGLRGAFLRKELKISVGKPFMIEPTEGKKIPSSLMRRLTTEMMQRIAAQLPEHQRGEYAP